ncbi:tetratricopeptide repeat protein 28-like [Physella acuta]|uniref:tetratricopeptide repeat protein 28-like n=1 Tax=Physella acuta TaxID=109671 RepID=UPI0027DE354B|nr:tetratricopeptide repeat protein 28-like [Physella acuta]
MAGKGFKGKNHVTGTTVPAPTIPAPTPSPSSQAMYLQKLLESSEAVKAGNFRRAIQLYTDAIELDPENHILYTNRSAAHLKNGQVDKSLEDAIKARTICPKWGKAYLREGVALQELGRHGDALAAFACGLGQEPGNTQLLDGLVEVALNSPLKPKLEPTFEQLEKFGLRSSPFVIIAVIGQELVAAGHFSAAVTILEAALKVGTCSLKLRGSVFSALSSALWGLGNLDKAIYHMQQDLAVAKNLGDHEGECRAYGNLGSAYFTKGYYKESLANHRFQLVLAMKLKNRTVASNALGSLGHVYTAIGDYPNALASHKQCVLLLKQSREVLAEAREIGNVGAVYLAMGNFENAVECHQEHLKIARSVKSNIEEARAYSNLGSAYHYKRDYHRAMMFHKEVLRIAEQSKDKMLEARAYAGLGHAARCSGDVMAAKMYHEKQLDNALQTKDKVAEGRACSNLGIIFHQLEEYEAALKLHKVHLKIAKALQDRASQGRAYGNIGNAYSALGKHELAVKQHKQELEISSEVNDKHSEGSTHGNLAVAYQALGKTENALHHYLLHLSISRELKDLPSEARALCNLGNFHCARGNHSSAVSFYEQFLALSKELNDSEGESKACFNLGYVHFNLGNFNEAVKYYEQDLAFARDRKDRLALARAYCNIGLAHKSLLRFDDALECQKKCLRLMDALENTPGKLRALGNIGDLMLKVGDITEAIKIYQQQLSLAKQCDSPDLLATAYGALGSAHRMLGQYDKSLGYHTQELTIRQEINDLRGECRAHGNVGNVHMSLGNFLTAFKCYQEMLDRSRELKDHRLEGQACGNLGITRMNMGQYEEAIGLLEEQLAMLEQNYGPTTLQDKGKAFGNLGDCYEALGDYEEAVKWHEQFLIIAQQTSSLTDQDRAYRGLGNAHKAIGNLQQALVCFEKRLFVAHQTDSAGAKASAYGELGCLHSLLGNLEQAIACLEHQLSLAQEMGDKTCQGDAACGLGGVYQQMGEYHTALTYHQMDLKIAEETNNTACQCRAYGNLGLSYESLGNLEESVRHQEQHLSIAAQMNDAVAKTLAFSSLGRVHLALAHYTQAVQYLQQGLNIAEQLKRREDEAKIRHRLGLALWAAGDLDQCQLQLHKAADLFEMIRRESQCSSEYRLSLFDLQTACYQTLQRVLVSLSRHDEALVIAERACTRAFIDLLLERQAGSAGLFNGTTMDLTPVSIEQILNTVSNQSSIVLCFSIAAGYLYSWLLTPKQGIIKFHCTRLCDLDSENEVVDTHSLISVSGLSLLDQCVGQVRECMGIESHITTTATGHRSSTLMTGHEYSDTDSEVDDVFQLQLEELGDKLNADSDRTGFLAMLNRSHTLNASSYSLGSVLSTGAASLTSNPLTSYGGSMRSLGLTSLGSGSLRGLGKKLGQRSKFASGKSPLALLYQILIEPMESMISEIKEAESRTSGAGHGTSDPVDLVLVLQGDLYLIPFLMLRREQAESFLFEKYTTLIVPSISALQNAQSDNKGRPLVHSSGALVVGNPRLTPIICKHWHLHEIPGAEFEARILGELLTCRPLIGSEATKGAILHQIEQVEVIHFAAHISWKLSSVVLSPGEFLSSPSQHFPLMDSDDSASDIGTMGGPSLSEYLLTAADILNLKLRAKLVVLNSGYTDDRAGRINTDGVVGLTRALLSAGAQCVLFSLWPVPDSASKLLMKTLYTALLDGVKVTKALSLAVKTVQTTAQFSHPSNWGGWVLVGSDITLSSKVALMGHALGQIVEAHSTCRQTLKVLLHLVEKSLQRIQQGCKNSMFTTQQSIENKVGQVSGWKDFLQAVGFRFEPSTGGLPPAVFFPQADPNERLTQASASLQAFLGLPTSSVSAMSKFVSNFDVGEALIHVMRDILSKLSAKESGIDVMVDVKLWGVSGCHEFLASLGLDLVDVGTNNVTLRLSKQAMRRHLQFALQALVSVFDTQDAPRTLHLDTSSSMESLSSNQSAPSSSTFSKSSATPPLSPHGRSKRSLFNPAEMEKVKNLHRNSLMLQGSLTGRHLDGSYSLSSTSEQSTPSASPRSPQSPQLDPALQLSHQARIRTMYGHHSAAGVMTSESGKTTPEVVELNLQEVGLNLDLTESNKMKQSASDNSLHVRKSSASLSSSFSDLEDKRMDRSRMSTMSLQSLSSHGKNSSFREELGSKSVTFAEKLISQEISFDAADTRYDPASLDCLPTQPSKNMQHKMLDMETSVTDFRQSNTGVGDANSQNSTKTAFQLREHFEKLNQQNISNGFNKSGSGLLTSDVADKKRVNSNENIALKVLADVSSQRTAVESMQRQSIIQSQEANRKLREERGLANYPVPAQRKHIPASSQVKDNSLASISNVDLEQHVNSLKINNSSQKLPTGSDVISRSGLYNTGFNGGQPDAPGKHSYPLPASGNQQLPLPRKQAKPQQSAYNALFPLGGPNKSPSPRITFNHSSKPVTSSPSILPRHLTSAQNGSGTGENSISSDHSEGAESNLQSSASSGYHSENSGLLGQAQTIPPPSHVSQDKGLYTQEFVNRTPSFTYSSGSSSPFSRASNDETGTDNGPDRPNINPLSNVLFPNQTPKQSLAVSSRSVNMKKHSMHTNQSTKSFPQPAVPLVRTNALQARPESSNSMSSQYSTSSSTLSTIYRPLGNRDSPKSRDQTSPMLPSGAHYTSVPPPPYSHTGYKTISPVSPSSHSFYPPHNPRETSCQKNPEPHLHAKLSNPAPLDCYTSSPNAVRRSHGSDQQFKTSSETKNYSMLDSNSNWDLENGDDYKSKLAAAQSNMYNPKSKLATSGYGDSRSSFQSFQSGSYGQNFIPMKTFSSNSAANAGGVKDRLQNKLEQDYHDPRVKDQHGYVIHSSKC